MSRKERARQGNYEKMTRKVKTSVCNLCIEGREGAEKFREATLSFLLSRIHTSSYGSCFFHRQVSPNVTWRERVSYLITY